MRFALRFPRTHTGLRRFRGNPQRLRRLVLFAAMMVLGLSMWALRQSAGEIERNVMPWLITLATLGLALTALQMFRARQRKSGAIEIDTKGLVRVDPSGGRDRLIDFAQPFGVTLMVSKRSGVGWLGFTTQDRTSLLLTEGSAFEGERYHSIDEDLDLGVAELHVGEARALVRELRLRENSAFQKMYLTGSQGESIVLDGPLFRVDEARFDLVLPYECRNFAFVERVGRVDGLYEATWIKQGGSEVVLVSSMGPEAETPVAQPPPRGLRHAVDRAFYPSLLSVLGSAKRAAGSPNLS